MKAFVFFSFIISSVVNAVAQCPTTFGVTGTTTVCQGTSVQITQSGSETDVTYQLRFGVGDLSIVVDERQGSGTAIVWEFVAESSSGYFVRAKRGSCSRDFSSVMITVNPSSPMFQVSQVGVCDGTSVKLSNSISGVNYTLSGGATVLSQGGELTWSQVSPGTKTVIATHPSNGCTRQMTGQASIVALPSALPLTGDANVCQGTSTFITLSGSVTNVDYELRQGDNLFSFSVETKPGNGGHLAWTINPEQTSSYFVKATDGNTGCVRKFGQVSVTVKPSSAVYDVSQVGTCQGVATVILSDSEGSNINYTINGSSPLAGNGGALIWQGVPEFGIITVSAINPTNGCTRAMRGSATISPLPEPFGTTSGPVVCQGWATTVTMDGSQRGVTYELQKNSWPINLPVESKTGDGNPITWDVAPEQTTNYVIEARDTHTGCVRRFGNVTAEINPSSNLFAVSQSGPCEGATVNLSSSNSGVTYTLDGLGTLNGGGPLSWPNVPAGDYQVFAHNTTTGCGRSMGGVTIHPLPANVALSAPTPSCQGLVPFSLSGSESDVNYFVMSENVTTTIGTGSGSPMTFDLTIEKTATYTGRATNIITGCSRDLNTINMVINSSSLLFNVSSTHLCADNAQIKLSGSQTEVGYTLRRNGVDVSYQEGNGSELTWSNINQEGWYSVQAYKNNGCERQMTGMHYLKPLPVFSTSVASPILICPGGSIMVKALSGESLAYSWSTGSATNTTTFNSPGTYSVTGTSNSTNCSATLPIVVNVFPATAPASVITGPDVLCSGSATLMVNMAGSKNFLWSTGATTKGISISSPGTYTVSFKDFVSLPWKACKMVKCDPTARIGSDYITSESELALEDELVADTALEDVSGHPNPADDIFTLSFPAPLPENVEIRVINSAGEHIKKAVAQKGETKKTISTKELPSGVYLMQLIGASRVVKVLVNH